MYIRKAKRTDANDLKVLYFEYLTHFPPKEEQDMDLWEHLLDKFEKDENMYLLVMEEEHRCYKVFLENGSNKESTLNFYQKNGFEIDKKHSCLKRM